VSTYDISVPGRGVDEVVVAVLHEAEVLLISSKLRMGGVS
jgi:hypothetical protein